MLPALNQPIVAIATAPGRGAVGILRLSGRDLSPLLQSLLGRCLQPRHATFMPFLAADGMAIDQGLALFFPAPHSYTGEDVLELQAHGGAVVLQLLLARCLDVGTTWGLRLAEPGEFTQRAFLNDKLDLAQAEAVADLIDASTEAAARSATRSLSGVFSNVVNELAGQLLKLRMLVESTLDFPEEEIDFLQQADALGQLQRAQQQLQTLRIHAKQGALLREGMHVVLAGQPNVGKSSLLNALAGAELAIVTPIAGTTRDRITQTIQIEGVPVHVMDTAGLRDEQGANDEVERIGMQRSWDAIGEADTVIFLHDLTRQGDPSYLRAEEDIAQRLLQVVPGQAVLHVFNKTDAIATAQVPSNGVGLSAKQGHGLEALRQALLQRCGWQDTGSEGVFIARARHVSALERTANHLEAASGHAHQGDRHLDLFAEELRLAHVALGEITGQVSADDLLGTIFSHFCIGK